MTILADKIKYHIYRNISIELIYNLIGWKGKYNFLLLRSMIFLSERSAIVQIFPYPMSQHIFSTHELLSVSGESTNSYTTDLAELAVDVLHVFLFLL